MAATTQVYDPVQRATHWATALIFLTAVALGFYASLQVPGTSPRREILEVHKSLGMSVLFLTLFRLFYRLRIGAPASLPGAAWQTRTAAATHACLYALMLAMPLSGYLFSSAGNYSLKYFWTFAWPRLFAGDHALSHVAETAHGVLAYLVYTFVALHLLGTAWHVLVLRDGVLRRMAPSAMRAAGLRR